MLVHLAYRFRRAGKLVQRRTYILIENRRTGTIVGPIYHLPRLDGGTLIGCPAYGN